MYINGTGRDYYEFYIQLNRCGTLGKNAIHEKSRESPTVINNFRCFEGNPIKNDTGFL